jgi:murein DD-endopeptidase MepM/ murein hydrolase activator NlpD
LANAGSAALTRGRVGTYAVIAAVVALATLLASALAAVPARAGDGTGGASPTPTPAPAPSATPSPTPPPPSPVRSRARLTRLACVSRCGEGGTVRPGGLLRVRGKSLRPTAEVDFAGAPDPADDVAAAPVVRRKTSVDVRVPLAAVSGPVTVLDGDGVASGAAPVPLTVAPSSPPAGGPSIDVDVQAPRAYFDAQRPISATYIVHDSRPATVQVQLVRVTDNAVIASWTPGQVPPETPQTVQWNGLAGGQVQRPGRYAFRVTAADDAGALRASSSANEPAPAVDPSQFEFLRNEFPIRGPHDYGGPVARFGGPRGHQGQDVFAACGTPLVAARGGVVKFKAFQSRAGNYLVIDGERTGIDFVYMHLRDAALVNRGDRVRTGQPIGFVGDTGDADGCHLHFEMWSAPGWYSGGTVFDPLPSLIAWDKRP